MNRIIKNITFLFLLLLTVGAVRAQVDDKGVTSTGKEIDCFTITPADKVVNEYGAVVTQPRLTRNGKIITDDCCPTLVESSLTDTVTCVSISMAATIQKGTFNSGILQVFSDANYSTSVGEFAASVTDNKITAKATGLTCYTRYYFKLTLNGQCEYVWTDSTRDATLEKATFCTVANVRSAAVSETDLSREHKYNDSDTQIDSVYDHQGNRYAVVQIGEQCWLKENMRCTTSPNGILNRGNTGSDYTTPYYYCPSENVTFTNGTIYTPDQFKEKFGLLYNFPGTMDINTAATSFSYPHRGICPEGWRVPTDAELTTLADSAGVGNTESGTGLGKLAGGCDWNVNDGIVTCPGNYSYANRNESGFSALPAGRVDGEEFRYYGSVCDIWSSTPVDAGNAWWRSFYSGSTYAMRSDHTRGNCVSVRCVRNPLYAVYPSVDSVSCTSMQISAQVIGLGSLTNKTVCAYTDEACTTGGICATNPTVSNDSIFAAITGLSCNTRYYIKVTATDGSHSVEAIITDSTRDMTLEKATFCTVSSARALVEGSDQSHEHLVEGSTTEIDSVYDHQGNAYAVVQIGEQCWLKENMRCTTSPRQGTSAGQVNLRLGNTNSVLSYTDPYYYDHNAAATQYAIEERGYLYNWAAAMDTSFTSQSQIPASGDFPNHRGICPQGWHVPTHTEWIAMEKIYMMESDGTPIKETTLTAPNSNPNVFPDSRGKGAGKYTASCGWIADDGATAPGNYAYANRNISGFSALPIGCFGQEEGPIKFYYLGESSDMWTATPVSQTGAWSRFFLNNNEGVYHNGLPGNKNYGFAVRCVRDDEYLLGEIQIDTVECSSFSVYAKMESGLAETFTATAFTDATYTTSVGLVTATTNAAKDTIFAKFVTLDANTPYYVRITASDNVKFDTSYATISTRCMCSVSRLLVQEDNVNFTNYEWGHEKDGVMYIDSVSDHEGNRYGVVQVGPQCWLAQNMRATTRPSTGENIDVLTSTDPLVNNSSNAGRYPQARWQTWIADSATRALVGPVYNWPAMVDYGVASGNPDVSEWYSNRRGLCPVGWHLHHSDEFDKVLVPNLGGDNQIVVRVCGGPVGSNSGDTDNDGYLWKKYTGANDLHPGAVENPMRNSSGLTFLASGQWCSGYEFNHRHAIHLSSSNQMDAANFKYYWIRPDETTITTGDDSKSDSHSMRCIRDGSITLSELVIDELTCTSAKFHSKFFNSDADTVVLNTIKAGASTSTEFIQNNKAASVRISNDTVYAEISNLDCDKTYSFYIKVFDKEYESYAAVKDVKERDLTLSESRPCTVTDIHNGVEISTGVFANKEWSSAANQIDSVSDHEGNVYEVVQIGNQCWLKENMRATTEPTAPSTSILQKPASTNTGTEQRAYYYENSTNYSERFGCLYNYLAAMNLNDRNTAFTNPHRGICPEGWHLPTDEEWFTLEKGALTNPNWTESTVVSASGQGYRGTGAGRLVAGCDWTNTSSSTTPNSYSYSERNITGFSVFPSGKYESGVFTAFGTYAIFWSTTYGSDNSSSMFYRGFARYEEGVERGNGGDPTSGFAVRCVRNN